MDQNFDPKTLKSKALNLSEGAFLNVPKNIIFPNELNQYLKDQLQLCVHEKATLQKRASESEKAFDDCQAKNEELLSKIREYEILCGKNEFISSSAVAASKIVELSKKVRERTSESELYKTKCSKLEHNLVLLKEKLLNIEQPEQKKAPDNELEEQVKQLQEKLNGTKNKLLEIKNQNCQLKNELKLANKWLQQETGEQFETLSNIHNTNSNWRGRAQIICDLQKKNSDLKEKIRNIQEKGSSVTTTSETKLEKKIDTYIKENSELKAQLEDFKKRFDGARAKTKYLEVECAVLKNKVSKLNTQVDDCRQEISSLESQLTIEKRFKSENKKQVESMIKKFEEEKEKSNVDLRKKECALQNLTKQLDEQKEEINALRSEGYKPDSFSGNQPDRQVTKEDRTISRLEAERQKLLELTELQCKRLDKERTQHHKTDMELRHERQKAAKLEAKLARQELEFSSKSSSYSANTNHSTYDDTAETLRHQLELAKENVEALRTRLEVEKHERKIDLQQFANILQADNTNNDHA